MENTNQKPLLFNIQLNFDQINVILATMGKLPYETIAPLMDTIQAQANQQLADLQQSQTTPPTSEIGATDVIMQ